MPYFFFSVYIKSVSPAKRFFFFLFILVLSSSTTHAQLCTGTPGAPVMLETFGTGPYIGPQLPPGITNYPYVAGWPIDGWYTISTDSDPNDAQGANWHNGRDHTGDLNGEMMVVNAHYVKGEFFRKAVSGLCPNTTYTFSAWLANVNTPAVVTGACAGQYVYPKILFNIENPNGTIAATLSTGDILTTPTLTWKQYGVTLTTGAAQTALNLVMINDGPGGCGNDIVIDDISFSICGPVAKIVANPPKAAYCIGENLVLNGTVNGNFNNPEYQWQYSNDNSVTWNNIPGEQAINLTLSPLTLAKKGSYRLLAAAAGNIGSLTCGVVSDTLVINVVPPPVFTINNPTACAGTPATLTATLDPSSAATGYTWNNGGSGPSITVSPGATAPYTATGTDVNGCKSMATGTVTIKPTPTASAQPVTMCSGETRTLFAAGNAASFTWSPATGLNATTGPAVNASPPNTTTYTLTGTTDGCSTTSDVLVTVNSKPTIAALPAGYCKGGSATLTATGDAISVTWSPATGLNSTSTTSVIASPANTTTYQLKGTLAGCSDSVNVTVTVHPIPSITMTVQNTMICAGGTTPLTAGSDAASTTYAWTPNDGSLNATTGPAVSANPAVTTTYTVTGKDGNGCTNTATGTVTVSNPTIVVLPHGPVCAGDTAELVASGSASYSWVPNDGSLNSTTGARVIAKPLNTTTYTVTGTNPGCATSPQGTVTVTVNQLPTVTIVANPSPICAGETATLTASGATTYQWKPDATLNGTTGDVLQVTPPASRAYYVQGTDNSGCKDSAFISVPVNPLPVISAPSPQICAGFFTSITATGASTFTWAPATGLSASSGAMVTANPIKTTTYTITGTDANNCSGTTTSTVTVNPKPELVKPGKESICFGTSILLTTGGAITYTWSPSTGLNQDTGVSVLTSPTASTEYKITGSSGAGCTDTTSAIVEINALPVVTAPPVQTCIGSSIPVTATSPTAVSFTWSPSLGLNVTNQATVNAKPDTTHTYRVTVLDSYGCADTTYTTVTVNPLPIPVIDTPPTICLGETTNLTVVNSAIKPVPATFTWSASPDLNTLSGATVIAKPVVVKSTYTVNVTDSNGCQASASVTVTAVNPVIPQISDSVKICQGEEATLTAGGGTAYLWQTEETQASITVRPAVSTIYKVKIMNSVCSDTASVKVTVKDEFPPALFIPNAFTPDDNRINEKFKVVSNSVVTNFKGLIFNRWGELIYEWDDIAEGWDGYINGTLSQIDVYVYKITAQTECEKKPSGARIGTVSIIR